MGERFVFWIDDESEKIREPCPKGKKICPKCHGKKKEPVTDYPCTLCDDNGCVPSYYIC